MSKRKSVCMCVYLCASTLFLSGRGCVSRGRITLPPALPRHLVSVSRIFLTLRFPCGEMAHEEVTDC